MSDRRHIATTIKLILQHPRSVMLAAVRRLIWLFLAHAMPICAHVLYNDHEFLVIILLIVYILSGVQFSVFGGSIFGCPHRIHCVMAILCPTENRLITYRVKCIISIAWHTACNGEQHRWAPLFLYDDKLDMRCYMCTVCGCNSIKCIILVQALSPTRNDCCERSANSARVVAERAKGAHTTCIIVVFSVTWRTWCGSHARHACM